MNLRSFFTLSLIAFLFVGCAGGIAQNQPAATPVAVMAKPSAQSTAPSQPKTSAAAIMKSGTFVSGEHETKGTVRIAAQNGQTSLELDSAFQTSEMGPDLVVALHKSANVLSTTKPPAYALKEGDYVVIAPLQKFRGSQRYSVPATIDLASYKSAVIWCRKFNATFGTATLN